jgi:hypothetical protein
MTKPKAPRQARVNQESVLAQAPAQNVPAVTTAQNGQAVHAYVAQSNHGTWLFPPHQGGGQNG